MKLRVALLGTALLFPAGSSFAQGASGKAVGHGDPYQPIGELNVKYKHVRSGKKAKLNWNIKYPTSIPDLLDVADNGQVRTKVDVMMKVRVAGVAFESGGGEIPVTVTAQIGNGGWIPVFSGEGKTVKPNEYVLEQVVPAGTTVNFSGQGEGYDPRVTGTSDLAVAGLKNGDEPPYYAPAYQQGDIESFLSGYFGKSNNGHGNNLDGVDSSNPGQGHGGPNGETDSSVDANGVVYDDEARNIVQIGPRDMIYLFELASRDPGEWWYDMQDIVIVVTYEPIAN